MLLINVRERLLRLRKLELRFAQEVAHTRSFKPRVRRGPLAANSFFKNVSTTKYFAIVVALALYKEAFDFRRIMYAELEPLAKEINKILQLGRAPAPGGTYTAWKKAAPELLRTGEECRFPSVPPYFVTLRNDHGAIPTHVRRCNISVDMLLPEASGDDPAQDRPIAAPEEAPSDASLQLFIPPPLTTATPGEGSDMRPSVDLLDVRGDTDDSYGSMRKLISKDLKLLARPLFKVSGTPGNPRNAKYDINARQIAFADSDEIRELWSLLGVDAFAIREYKGRIQSYLLPLSLHSVPSDNLTSAESSGRAIVEWIDKRRKTIERWVTDSYKPKEGAWMTGHAIKGSSGSYSLGRHRPLPVASLTTTMLAVRGLRSGRSADLGKWSLAISKFLESMRTEDGGYAQNHDSPTGGVVLDEPRYTSMGIGIALWGANSNILNAVMYLLSRDDIIAEDLPKRRSDRYAYNQLSVLWAAKHASEAFGFLPNAAGVLRRYINTQTLTEFRQKLRERLVAANPFRWHDSEYPSIGSGSAVSSIRECAICLDLIADLTDELPPDYIRQSVRNMVLPIVEEGNRDPRATRRILPYMPWLATSVAAINLRVEVGAWSDLLDAMLRYIREWWAVKNLTVQHRTEIAASLLYGHKRISTIIATGKGPSFLL